jgi:hypothetical protein
MPVEPRSALALPALRGLHHFIDTLYKQNKVKPVSFYRLNDALLSYRTVRKECRYQNLGRKIPKGGTGAEILSAF